MTSTRENALDAGARRRFGFALAILRVALGLFLLVFALEKFIISDTTVAIYQHLYGVSASPALVYALGALEVLLAITIIVGAFRRWSYALGLLVHGATTIATARLIIDPWGLISGEPQHLYFAAVPVLAAFAALYLLRDLDCFSFEEWRSASGRHAPQAA